MINSILALVPLSFVIAYVATWLMMNLAPRLGFVDKPGHRKIHDHPKPLGGGVAIFLGLVLPMAGALLTVWSIMPPEGALGLHWSGIREQTPLALKLLAALAAMHVMGLCDDRKAMGPWSKLLIQLAVTAGLVVWADIRALTVLGYVPSVVVTVLWITAITNAFNFLDNMDGLSAGVGAVATLAFLITALWIGQWFVAATLALLLGALLGFLCFNFNPASIFMGDSGSLLIGLVLGVMTIRTTYLPTGRTLAGGWYAVLAPVIVLAVPLYDLTVVSALRLLAGKSPFVGDTNHLSHRLVRRGMSRRTAVLCIYLMTAATSSAAIVLPHVESGWVAACLFAQTLLILGLVMLLEQHPLPSKAEGKV
jgi:UDP-GlcNAc:undecaprenyl-phosphate/decaprenyl-phosphate GlcNAc-1-phosphate transferase